MNEIINNVGVVGACGIAVVFAAAVHYTMVWFANKFGF